MQGTKVVPSKKVRWSFQIFARLKMIQKDSKSKEIMYVVLKVQETRKR